MLREKEYIFLSLMISQEMADEVKKALVCTFKEADSI